MTQALENQGLESIPGWIRTSNLRLRRPTRYPIVPRGQKCDKTRQIMTRRDGKRQEALSARVYDTAAFFRVATHRDILRRSPTFRDGFLQSTLQSTLQSSRPQQVRSHAKFLVCPGPVARRAVPCPGVPVLPTFPRPFFGPLRSVCRYVGRWSVGKPTVEPQQVTLA